MLEEMRCLQIILEIAALLTLAWLAVESYRSIDFDISIQQEVEDRNFRDYVVSHDLQFVKDRLVEMQKEKWAAYVEASDRARTQTLLFSGLLLVFLVAVFRGWRRPARQ